MGNDGIKAMTNILDNSSNISKEIRNEVYKLLGLNTQSEQLSEFVNECLERFEFNSEEVLFLEQLRMIANEEINIINEQRKNNEQVNYETFETKLVERFKESEKLIINLDDNMRDLANQIVSRFPQINVSSDQLYNHFMSKKEQIVEMINQHNKDIVEALIKITPQLSRDLESSVNTINNQNTSGTLPRTPAVEDVYGAQDNRAANLQELREMQEKMAREKEHTEAEKQAIREQMQQAQEQMTQTLNWAKQQPNVPQFTSTRSDKIEEYPEWTKDNGISGYTEPTVDQVKEGLEAQKFDEIYESEVNKLIDLKKNNNPNYEIELNNAIKTISSLTDKISDVRSQIESDVNYEISMEQQTQPKQQSVNYLSINDFHSKCIDKLAEVDRMFRNGGNDKSEIAKVSRQLKSFIDSLDNRVYAGELLEKYEKVSDYAISVIYDQIMFENVPMLKEIYEKHQDLLNDENIRKPNEPTNPNERPPMTTYVGANSEEIRNLINTNNYYSILHGLSKEDVAKYSGFIDSGYQIIINDYLARASKATTFEEKHNSYFELYEIYQNFRDYLPLEQANQLKEQLDSMQSYLNEQRKITDDSGVRYNTEAKEEQSAMHR